MGASVPLAAEARCLQAPTDPSDTPRRDTRDVSETSGIGSLECPSDRGRPPCQHLFKPGSTFAEIRTCFTKFVAALPRSKREMRDDAVAWRSGSSCDRCAGAGGRGRPRRGRRSGRPVFARHGAKPTFVLVHGAWADASSWSGEVDRLQRDGYVVRAIANPLRGLTSDP